MTDGQKQLLLKDLCARLTYNPYIFIKEDNIKTLLTSIEVDKDGIAEIWYSGTPYSIEDIKPYLRPMSSMTEDENELFKRLKNEVKNSDGTLFIANCNLLQRFFRSRHIDNNHLIESGLAIEAPEGMYKNE